MRKAVAVPYIIALILGVAVIGLVGYWFIATGGKFGGQSAKTVCDNKFLQWCVTGGGSFATFAPECAGLVSYNDCTELTGVQGGEQGQQIQPQPPAQCKNAKEICGGPNDGQSCCDNTCTFNNERQVWEC